MATRVVGAVASALAALPEQAVYLVPLRVFIGLGWVRAATEKLADAGWRDGSALRAFQTEQLDLGWTLPFYEPLLDWSGRAAVPLGVGLTGVELAIGAAILLGARTTPALLVAITLNLNFIFAGQTNPSVFYIVAELVLLAGGAGTLLGWDGRAADKSPPSRREGVARIRLRRLLAWSLAGALSLLPFGQTLAPAAVIHDPALVVALLLLLVAGGAGLRLGKEPTAGT